MNDPDSPKRVFIQNGIKSTEFGLLIAILITLGLKLRLIFLLNIDDDEFTFLSLVHRYLSDAPLSQFFTFHVHFFSWLPSVSGNEVAQIFTARMVMFGLGLGSCIFLYLIGRLFFNRTGVLFSVLCYLSISNVIVHGASFRFDPMCVILFLCAAYFLLREPRSLFRVTIAGFSMALSLMISLKTILYMPTIGAIFFLQLFLKENKKRILKEIILFSLTLVIGFVLLYYFHISTLAKSVASPNKVVNNLASQGILFKEFFPNIIYMLMIIKENSIVWVYWIGGLILLVWDLIYTKDRPLFEDFAIAIPFSFHFFHWYFTNTIFHISMFLFCHLQLYFLVFSLVKFRKILKKKVPLGFSCSYTFFL